MIDAETQRRNLEAVQTMAANGILGNWDVVRPFVADDIVLRVPETLPWGGERRGWDGYQQALTIMTAFFTDIAVSDVSFTPVEDTVIIRMIISARVVATGKAISMPLLEVWRVRDGKVCDITAFFFDTKVLVDP
jgi:ketosteroid isomerase-like protein